MTPVRIWHQSMASLEAFPGYGQVLRARTSELTPAGVEVTLHGVDADAYGGQPPAAVLRYPYLRHLVQRRALAACVDAEAEGYDVVAFASFSEPFLPECRSAVSIPVVSMAEASLLVGCTLARRMALLTLTPASVPRVLDLVRSHALEDRVSAIVPLDPPTDEGHLAAILGGSDPARFRTAADRALDRAAAAGADVVVPAEGMLNEVLHRHHSPRADGVAVLDGLAIVLAYAEMLVRLSGTGAVAFGRRLSYPLAPVALRDAVRAAEGGRA